MKGLVPDGFSLVLLVKGKGLGRSGGMLEVKSQLYNFNFYDHVTSLRIAWKRRDRTDQVGKSVFVIRLGNLKKRALDYK